MQEENGLRWFVGVPVVTNPFIVLDVVLAAVMVWVGASVVIGLGQQVIGSGLTRASVFASVFLAGYLALGILAVFFVVGLFVLGNKYVALYRVDERGVYVETMRGIGFKGGLFHVKPFPTGPVSRAKSSSRLIPWDDIHGVQGISSMRVIVVKNKKGGTITKVYCPSEDLYAEAETAIKQKAG